MSAGSEKPTYRFDRNESLVLLEKLNDKLAERDVETELYVVGGTAMILEYGAKRRTRDVDCEIRSGHNAVHEAKAEVAQEHGGLDPDWLNETAAKTFLIPEEPDEDARVSYKGSHLTVLTASPDRLLAMKLITERESDRPDIMKLVTLSSVKSGSDAVRLVQTHFPHKKVDDVLVRLVDAVIAGGRDDLGGGSAAMATGAERPSRRTRRSGPGDHDRDNSYKR